ncbi:MAG: thioredoxin family protein [Sulfurimonas sp.]
MKLITLITITLFTLNIYATEASISESPYNFVKLNIGHGKPHLIELGSEKCPACKIMGRTLYKAKKENPNFNISYINISKDRSVATSFGVQMIPTQIIFDKNGVEAYRHVGKLSRDELLEVFKKYQF